MGRYTHSRQWIAIPKLFLPYNRTRQAHTAKAFYTLEQGIPGFKNLISLDRRADLAADAFHLRFQKVYVFLYQLAPFVTSFHMAPFSMAIMDSSCSRLNRNLSIRGPLTKRKNRRQAIYAHLNYTPT